MSDIPEGYTAVDPEIATALKLYGSATPMKPTLGNNYDSRSPRDILLAQMNEPDVKADPGELDISKAGGRKSSAPSPVPDGYSLVQNTSSDIPDGYSATPPTPPSDIPEGYTATPPTPDTSTSPSPVKQPSMGAAIGQDVASTVGSLGNASAMLGGGLLNAVGAYNTADQLYHAGEGWKKGMDNLVLSPEEQAKESLPQKAVGALAGGLSYIAAGPFAVPAMVMNSQMTTGTELLKQNVDAQRANVAATQAWAGTTLLGVIPGMKETIDGIAPSLLNTVGRGVATNVGQQVVTDYATKTLFPDRPDIQKQYDPTLEKIVIAAAGGAGFGAVLHATGGAGRAVDQYVKTQAEAAFGKYFVDQFSPTADGLLGTGERYTPPEGMTHDAEKKRLIFEGSGNLKQISDLIAGDKDATVFERAVANVFSRLAPHLGLEDVKVSMADLLKEDQTKNNKGEYDPNADQVNLREDQLQRPDLNSLILHEMVHAITDKAISLRDRYTNEDGSRKAYTDENGKTTTIDDLTPHQQDIISKVDNLKTVYDLAQAKAREYIPDEAGKSWQQILDENRDHPTKQKEDKVSFFNEHYGFKDLNEFASEVMTNPAFAAKNSKVKLSNDEVVNLKTTFVRPIKNLWQGIKEKMMEVVGMQPGNTLHDIAFDHVTGLIESINAADRHQNSAERRGEEIWKSEDFSKNSESTTKAIFQRIANLLSQATTKDMFITRLNAHSQSPIWRDWVARNADKMWDNPHQVIDAAGPSDYEKLPISLKRMVNDDRTVDQFFADTFKDQLSGGKVTDNLKGYQDLNTEGSWIFSPSILNMLKEGQSAAVMRYFNQKASEYKSMTEVLYHDALVHFQKFNAMPRKEQLKLFDTISYYDRPENRKKIPGQWLTDDILAQHGHSQEAINAYHDITHGEEFLWSLINQAQVHEGKGTIPMIPGYMPHVFPGAYKVLIQRTTKDGTQFIMGVRSFQTRWGAAHYVKQLEAGKYDDEGGTLRPEYDTSTWIPAEFATAKPRGWRVQKHDDVSNSLMASIQEHLKAYKNESLLEPGVFEALEKIERDNLTGITKHALERSDVHGYQGEFGQRGSLLEKLGVGSSYNNKTLKLFQNYARNVVEHYRNVTFTQEVLSPMTETQALSIDGKTYYGTLFANTPQLTKHLAEFASNFTGKNVNHLNFIDRFLQNQSIELGIDPLLYRKVNRVVRNLLSLDKLRVNPRNYVANTIQPAHAFALLELANEMMRRDGLNPPEAVDSMTKAIKNRFTPDDDMASALAWAMQNHHLDAQLEYELRSKQLSPVLNLINKLTLGNVNPAIESTSRTTTFMMTYEHFRQVFPDNPDRARTAAVHLMEMTMVNYDRSSRPLMYQNFGVAGEALSPFAVFRNAYVGNTYLLLRAFAQNPSIAAARPIIASQLTFLVTAGAMGMIGFQEYDSIVQTINKYMPEWAQMLPTGEEILFKHHVPDVIAYGALSEGTKVIPGLDHGLNLGTSMNAVTGGDLFSAAMIPFVEALGSIVGVSAKTLASMFSKTITPPPAEDTYQAVKQLAPGILKGQVDRYYNNSKMGYGKEGRNDVIPSTSNLSGAYERDNADWNAIDFTGARSLKETKETNISRIISNNEKAIKDAMKDLVSIGVDSTMGIHGNITLEQARARAIEFGMTADAYNQAVVKGNEDRRLSTPRKESYIDSVIGIRMRNERQKMMGY